MSDKFSNLNAFWDNEYHMNYKSTLRFNFSYFFTIFQLKRTQMSHISYDIHPTL